jgi:hypothetical protein
MKTSIFFGYFITFLYCSELPKEKETKPAASSNATAAEAEKTQESNLLELRRVRSRAASRLSIPEHERNLSGLRDILIKIRAKRKIKNKGHSQN